MFKYVGFLLLDVIIRIILNVIDLFFYRKMTTYKVHLYNNINIRFIHSHANYCKYKKSLCGIVGEVPAHSFTNIILGLCIVYASYL